MCGIGVAARQKVRRSLIALRTLIFFILINLGTLAAVPLFWDADDLSSEAQISRGLLLLGVFYPLSALGIGLVLCTMRRRNGYRGLHEFASGTRVVRLPYAETRRPVRAAGGEQALEHPLGLPERLGGFVIRGALRWEQKTKVLLGEDTALERRVAIWLRPDSEPPLADARRALTRTTRLRWLASSRHDTYQWDAFMAPTGMALAELVAGEGPEAWSEVRMILEQLAAELASAAEDKTLPWPLTVDQVLIQNNGQVQLLDWQPRVSADAMDGEDCGQDSSRPLALLAEVAVLALEGHPWSAEDSQNRERPVRAVLPEYAADFLARLVGTSRPYRAVQEFQAGLEACRDRPAQVTAARRAACLALSSTLVGFVLLSCMIPAGWLPGMVTVILQTVELEAKSKALRDLEQGTWREAAASAVNPDPLVRLVGVSRLQGDLQLRDELKKQIEEEDNVRQARLATNGLLKVYTQAMDKELKKQKAQGEVSDGR